MLNEIWGGGHPMNPICYNVPSGRAIIGYYELWGERSMNAEN